MAGPLPPQILSACGFPRGLPNQASPERWRTGTTTIRDVARRAGVAVSTVSLVINNRGRVSAATRRRVMEAVRELGYRPSAVAKRLAQSRTSTVSVLLPTLSNPFFGAILHALQGELQARGLEVIVYETQDDPQIEAVHLEASARNRVEGVLVVGEHTPLAGPNDNRILDMHRSGLPVVLVERQIPAGDRPAWPNRRSGLDRPNGGKGLDGANGTNGPPDPTDRVPAVFADKREGMLKATRHLLQLGHRRIGFIGGYLDRGWSHHRLEGFRAALEEAGLALDEGLVADGRFTPLGGYRMARYLLESEPELTALVVASDWMAVGALRAIHELRLPVPGRVSVVGFDDIPASRFLIPALTTVSIGAERLGRTAAAMLIDWLEGRPLRPPEVSLPVELVVRESTGPAWTGS